MSDMKITAMVSVVEDTKTFGAKGFRKRVLVLEQESGSYTNYIPIDLCGERCNDADGLRPGDMVEVEYRLNGRKWQKDASSEVKYFLSAEATALTVIRVDEGPVTADPGDAPADVPF